MGSRTMHPVTADSSMHPAARGNASFQTSSRLGNLPASAFTSTNTHNEVVHSNEIEGSGMLPARSVLIPTAICKRKMKDSDRPGMPTGTTVSARSLFNRLYQQRMGRSQDEVEDDFPIYPEMANAIKDDVRMFLYQRLNLERGVRTYTSVKNEFSAHLATLKKRLVETYPVLSTAQKGWVMDYLIKEAIQRDKKATVEALKRKTKGTTIAPRNSGSTNRSVPGSSRLPSGHLNGTHITSRDRPKERRLALQGDLDSDEYNDNGGEESENVIQEGRVTRNKSAVPLSQDTVRAHGKVRCNLSIKRPVERKDVEDGIMKHGDGESQHNENCRLLKGVEGSPSSRSNRDNKAESHERYQSLDTEVGRALGRKRKASLTGKGGRRVRRGKVVSASHGCTGEDSHTLAEKNDHSSEDEGHSFVLREAFDALGKHCTRKGRAERAKRNNVASSKHMK